MGITVISEGPTSSPLVVDVVTQITELTPVLVSAQTLVGPQGPQGIQGVPGPAGGGIAGTISTFLQPTTPDSTDPYLWIQTGLGDGTGFAFWMEDGL